MNRLQWVLAGVLASEAAVGGYLALGRLNRPAPPLPDLGDVDRLTAAEIRGLAANAHTPAGWGRLGEVYLATGFFPEAEACYRQAAALAPADADLAFRHAFTLERLGLLEEANAAYRTATERGHPRAADVWYYVGRNHLRLGQAEPAAEAFGRAADLPAARFELAKLAARAGRVEEAGAAARQLADQFPEAYPVTSLRYRLALAASDSPTADRLADQFPRHRQPLPTPFDAEVDWVFGVANGVGRDGLFRDAGRDLQAGRPADAEAKLRRVLGASWSPEVADKLADVLFGTGKTAEATGLLAEAVERGGPSWEQLWRLGQAYEALGQPQLALAAWERAARVATGPAATGLWQDLAGRYEATGEIVKAKDLQARAHLATGVDHLDAGRPPQAIEALTRAAETAPERPLAWYFLGEARRAAGQPAEARAAYERCLSLDPDSGRAGLGLRLLK